VQKLVIFVLPGCNGVAGTFKMNEMEDMELLKLLVDWIQNNNRAVESLERFCEDCGINFEIAMEAIKNIYNNG